jgi:hypothetical protein
MIAEERRRPKGMTNKFCGFKQCSSVLYQVKYQSFGEIGGSEKNLGAAASGQSEKGERKHTPILQYFPSTGGGERQRM